MRRVVVTGLGAVTPCGNDVPTTWAAMREGRSGVGPVTRFDASSFPVRIAAEVKGFDPELRIDRKLIRRLDLFAQYAMTATHEAMEHAGLGPTDGDPRLVGSPGTELEFAL